MKICMSLWIESISNGYNKPFGSFNFGELQIFSELKLDGNTDCALPMLSLSRCRRRSRADVGLPQETWKRNAHNNKNNVTLQ